MFEVQSAPILSSSSLQRCELLSRVSSDGTVWTKTVTAGSGSTEAQRQMQTSMSSGAGEKQHLYIRKGVLYNIITIQYVHLALAASYSTWTLRLSPLLFLRHRTPSTMPSKLEMHIIPMMCTLFLWIPSSHYKHQSISPCRQIRDVTFAHLYHLASASFSPSVPPACML